MIKHDRAFRVLGEEHVYFNLVGRVCGVTKLLEITFYPTVIIKRDWEREKEMERERVLKEKKKNLFQPSTLSGMKHNMNDFRSKDYN